MSTASQISANQANAQLSTGPKTEAGKAKSAFNALKTGLTGHTVLLPSEDASFYQQHLVRFISRYKPQTPEEQHLVQSLADTEWRLLRIPSLESGIYALGQRNFADLFSDQTDPAVRAAFIQAHTFMAYRKDLSNLSLQERRLRIQFQADAAALTGLQNALLAARKQALKRAASNFLVSKRTGEPFVPSQFGFDFALPEIEEAARQIKAQSDAAVAEYNSFMAKKAA
jgi:hypothetical protein